MINTKCTNATALFTITLLFALLAIFLNSMAIRSSFWRNCERYPESSINEGYSLGLDESCNYTIRGGKPVIKACSPLKNESLMIISGKIYQVGFAFQIIGTLALFLMVVFNLIADSFAHNWNLYVIFCSAVQSFFIIGLLIIFSTTILFVSEPRQVPRVCDFRITVRSTSLVNCFFSILFSLIVIGLTFFSLSFASNRLRIQVEPLKQQIDVTSIGGGDLTIKSNQKCIESSVITTASVRIPPPPPPPPQFPPPPISNRQSEMYRSRTSCNNMMSEPEPAPSPLASRAAFNFIKRLENR